MSNQSSTVMHLALSEAIEYNEIGWVAAVITGVLAIVGALYVLVSAVDMYLAPDALSQVNMLGPVLGMGIPLLVAADLVNSWATEGFTVGYFVRAIVAIITLLVSQSVGSYVLGRALHATMWDHTVPLSGGTPPREKESII